MINEKLISKLAALFFVIIIITDFYYKYIFYNNSEVIKLTLIKVFIGAFLATFIALSKQTAKKSYVFLGLLFVSCVISLLIQDNSMVNHNIYHFSKYAFGILAMLFFFKEYERLQTIYLKKIILGLVLLNFVFILLGFFFNIHAFETYYGDRFGYNGIFKSTSTASYFYMLSLIYYLLYRHKNYLTYILLSIIVLSSLFVGSKTLIAFIVITSTIVLGRLIASKQKLVGKNLFYVLYIFIVSTLSIYGFKLYLTLNTTLNNVLTKDGMLSAFFSYRDVHFNEALTNIKEHYSVLNFLFGGASFIERLPEMAFIDLLLSFGLIGAIVYMLLLKHTFPKVNNKLAVILFVVIGVAIMLRGNFLYYPSVIYITLAIFTVIIKEIQTNTKLE